MNPQDKMFRYPPDDAVVPQAPVENTMTTNSYGAESRPTTAGICPTCGQRRRVAPRGPKNPLRGNARIMPAAYYSTKPGGSKRPYIKPIGSIF